MNRLLSFNVLLSRKVFVLLMVLVVNKLFKCTCFPVMYTTLFTYGHTHKFTPFQGQCSIYIAHSYPQKLAKHSCWGTIIGAGRHYDAGVFPEHSLSGHIVTDHKMLIQAFCGSIKGALL